MVKFKNFMFNMFGISFHLGVLYLLYLSIHGLLTDFKGNFRIDWALGIMCVFLIFLVIVGGRYFFKFIDREIYSNKKWITILGYIYYFRELKDKKWIYHSDLGYYLCIITNDDIMLFEPHFLYMHEIYSDISACGVSYDGKHLYENYPAAVLHAKAKIFSVNESAKMYIERRIIHRTGKLIERGWEELSNNKADQRDLKIAQLLTDIDFDYVREYEVNRNSFVYSEKSLLDAYDWPF